MTKNKVLFFGTLCIRRGYGHRGYIRLMLGA